MKRWVFQTRWLNEKHTLFSGQINDHISLECQIQVGDHFQGALGRDGGNTAEGRRSHISPWGPPFHGWTP